MKVGLDAIEGGVRDVKLPPEIHIGRKSPTIRGIKWLHLWLKQNADKYGLKNGKVLEFSAGITSWAVAEALYPSREVIIENEHYCQITNVKSLKEKDYFANVEIYPMWEDIPDDVYDLVLVDGSSGATEAAIKKMNSTIMRREAIQFSEKFHREGTIVVIHDWGGKGPYRIARRYMNRCNRYELITKIELAKKGFGIFRRLNVDL